jgi:hypothetical protein
MYAWPLELWYQQKPSPLRTASQRTPDLTAWVDDITYYPVYTWTAAATAEKRVRGKTGRQKTDRKTPAAAAAVVINTE